jgi:hypothetical protein
MEEEKQIIGEDPEIKRLRLIFTRNQLLAESDKYVLIDYPISADDLLIMKQYRQQLRDFTNNDYIIPDFPL